MTYKLLTAFCSVLVASCCIAGCCSGEQSRFCIEARAYAGRLAIAADECCRRPANEQSACRDCLSDIISAAQSPTTGLGALYQACQNEEWDRFNTLLSNLIRAGEACGLKVPLKPNPASDIFGGAAMANPGAIFTRTEVFRFDWSLSQSGQAGLRAANIMGQLVPEESSVGALRDLGIGFGIVETTDDTIQSREYSLPVGATLTVVRGAHSQTMTAAGLIALTSPTAQTDGLRTGRVVGLTLDVWNDDQAATLDLIGSNPRCSYSIDASGRGTLGAEVRYTIRSRRGLFRGPFTIWLSIPATFATDGTLLSLGSETPVAGDVLTPTSAAALAFAEAFDHPTPDTPSCPPGADCAFRPIPGTPPEDPLYERCLAARMRFELRTIAPWCFP